MAQMKGIPLESKTSKLKLFLFILVFEVARFPLVPCFIRMALYRIAGMRIDKDVYIGNGLKLSDPSNAHYIKIGKRVSMADNIFLINTASPNNSNLKKIYPRIIGEINIRDDAWLGVNAIIMPGITVGKMSVVGSGSVVTSDVEEYCAVAGNPARVIKKFSIGNEP